MILMTMSFYFMCHARHRKNQNTDDIVGGYRHILVASIFVYPSSMQTTAVAQHGSSETHSSSGATRASSRSYASGHGRSILIHITSGNATDQQSPLSCNGSRPCTSISQIRQDRIDNANVDRVRIAANTVPP